MKNFIIILVVNIGFFGCFNNSAQKLPCKTIQDFCVTANNFNLVLNNAKTINNKILDSLFFADFTNFFNQIKEPNIISCSKNLEIIRILDLPYKGTHYALVIIKDSIDVYFELKVIKVINETKKYKIMQDSCGRLDLKMWTIFNADFVKFNFDNQTIDSNNETKDDRLIFVAYNKKNLCKFSYCSDAITNKNGEYLTNFTNMLKQYFKLK